jgi:hypothetical protein
VATLLVGGLSEAGELSCVFLLFPHRLRDRGKAGFKVLHSLVLLLECKTGFTAAAQ